MTNGWKLTRESREALLAIHPPRYANVVADHVTLSISASEPPPEVAHALLVGRTDDRSGVEAMVVAIAGSTDRPDGKVWHVTWSLAEGRAARESNDAIEQLGFKAIPMIEVELVPALW